MWKKLDRHYATHQLGRPPPSKSPNAGVAVWISEKGQPLSSPFKGSATLTDAQADDLQKGMWYVNVHRPIRAEKFADRSSRRKAPFFLPVRCVMPAVSHRTSAIRRPRF